MIWLRDKPHVFLETKSKMDIKAAMPTKFKQEEEMMAFIILVCNVDWDVIATSVTGIMAWYKEWQFYFEFILGVYNYYVSKCIKEDVT